MKWITALDLERWADTMGARLALSELVSALIRASAADIGAFRFPTGDSAQLPGYDGRLTAVGAPPYVPDGESVWEFGTSGDYRRKADEDFQQRTVTPGSAVRTQTTIVLVTPRRWDVRGLSMEEWQEQKRREVDWKDVRIIDGVGLEDWLSQHDAVGARVARSILGVVPAIGARSTEEFWEEYSSRFRPPLTKEVLLCEREDQAKELLAQLSGEAQDIVLRADSPDEAVAFAIAAIRSADSDLQKYLAARTLVLDTDEAARQVNRRARAVFIVRGTAVSLGGLLARYGTTIIATGRDRPTRSGVRTLNRPSTYALRDAIRTMGFDEERAYQLARTCGRSVTVLARRIPGGDAGMPPWADGRRTLIPALLAGGWDGDSPEDQAIVASLAGGAADYGGYEEGLHPLERLQDPPIDREGRVWKIRAPVDAFVHLAPLIGRTDLERLHVAATVVFSEYDPSLELPDEERPFAGIRGKRLRHSEWLRDGLATTLLLIAVLHEEAGLIVTGTTPERFVEDLVAALPGLNLDYRLLASLGNQLPMLMEAAPRPLLGALEQMLEGDGGRIRPIFREGGLLGTSSPHTDVLWGLETLAWDPGYLGRVTLILARLAKADPGGTLHNRPMNSLREIFLSWHPSTNATLVQRLAVLDQLIADEPTVGWDLLVMLFPEQRDVAHNTSQPRFREAGASEREVTTWGRVYEGSRQVVGRALALLNDDPNRWATILKEMSAFEGSLRSRALELFQDFVHRGAGHQAAFLWTTLQKELNRHRTFPTAEWALTESELAQWDAVLRELEPHDIGERVAWLFNEHFPFVPSAHDERRREAVDAARAEAVKQVHASGGPDALVALARSVKFPAFIAQAAYPLLEDEESYATLIDAAIGGGERLDNFALALSGEAQRRFGDGWRVKVAEIIPTKQWSPDQLATLFLGWPDAPETWQVVTQLGPSVDEEYWRRKIGWPLPHAATEVLAHAARKYLSVGRGTAALDIIENEIHRLPLEIVYEVLDAVVIEIAKGEVKPHSNLSYHLGEVLKELAQRNDAPRFEVAKREYAILPLLGYRDETLTLHRVMADDPGFFVSVLCDVFRRHSGDLTEPTEVQRARAEIGYRLLSSFQVVPGFQDDQLDVAALRQWVLDVRRLAAEADRAEICDEYIGHVLAHAPVDPDDQSWPHYGVCDLIEELRSNGVELGIRIERHNMRGVVSKAVYEGGEQERALAEEARGWARAAEGWPRTTAMLHELSRSWDRDAAQEDERARQDQMRDG
jgi:hypothetical protein